MSMIPVEDLRILITGGARGIGAATARLLAEAGAQVMITDLHDDEGQALAAELGAKATYRRLDVTQPEEWRAAVTDAESRFGRVNALFNNAGIVDFAGVADCTPEAFRNVLDINLYGVFLGIHLTTPALRRAGGGVIVNTSSTAGLQGYGGLAAYVASKWGVRGLSKASALDLSPDNIRVLSLHPGPIRTPMTADLTDETASAQPIARFGEAEEVARMVRFMICEASYSTGSEFVIDGGAVTGQILPTPASGAPAETGPG
jgi:3alpha(or 20beta)-hydroxysteroid dehydrogenase